MAILTDSSKRNYAASRRATVSGRSTGRAGLTIVVATVLSVCCVGVERSAAEESDGGKSVWEVEVDPALIVNQYADLRQGVRACGPASVINSLRFSKGNESEVFTALLGGDDETRMRFLIDRWFAGRDSVVATGSKRYGRHGCFAPDLLAGYNELLKEHRLPFVSGEFLDREVAKKAGEGGEKVLESNQEFVRRVHRKLAESLRDGLPPIVSLRSFVARRHDGESSSVNWGKVQAHFVVVTSVPRKLAEHDHGFRFEFIDPNGARKGSAWVYAEQHLSFRAFRGSNGVGRWLDGKPFLLVIAPTIVSLQPKKAEWRDRVIVTLDYAVYRD